MIRTPAMLGVIACLVFVTGLTRAADDGAFLSGLDSMAPADRYRQLSLMLMVTDGVDQALLDALGARIDATISDSGQGSTPGFDFDQYTTPLIRIVDQESMLAAATHLFLYTRAHAPAIAGRIGKLRESDAEAIDPALEHAIAEDAIIIRNAISDSIDYATLGNEPGAGTLSAGYRARTIYLRNNLEFELFSAELDRITRDAVASVSGKTDAYERMFDEEVDAAALDRKIRAAEYAYGWDREFDERAARMAEEILKNIWDEEIELDP